VEVEPGGRAFHPQLAAEGCAPLRTAPQGVDLRSDILDLLIIRGIGPVNNPATSVAWAPSLAADKVFELLGDYNGNGAVDSADYVLWRVEENQTGPDLPADGDDNDVVNSVDYDVWFQRYGNTFTLDSVFVA
jgi:hypothetical protein